MEDIYVRQIQNDWDDSDIWLFQETVLEGTEENTQTLTIVLVRVPNRVPPE
jgi:hypothetical protein